MIFPFTKKNIISSSFSVALHGLIFLIGGGAIDAAQFGVTMGQSSIEVAAKNGENVEVTLVEDVDSPVVIKKKKIKKKKETVQILSTSGKDTTSVSASSKGAITDAQPNYLKNPAPVYPSRARNQGQQGLVQIIVDVNSDGSVKDILLKRSSGFLLLDDAAIRAVKDWQFLPANHNGIQVESRVEVPVRFKISKSGSPEISVRN